MPRINRTKTDARDARDFADTLTEQLALIQPIGDDTMQHVTALLPRRSMSTERDHADWRAGILKRRPISNLTHVRVVYGGEVSEVAYYASLASAKLAQQGRQVDKLAVLSTPLHLLTERAGQ